MVTWRLRCRWETAAVVTLIGTAVRTEGIRRVIAGGSVGSHSFANHGLRHFGIGQQPMLGLVQTF